MARAVTSALDFVYRKEDEYTAKTLFDKYRNSLPMMVVVVRGFYGNRDEMTFCSGQVLRLHGIQTQKRVMLHEAQGKSLTVPLDYPLLFTVAKSKEKMTLLDITNRYRLPVKVTFADPSIHIDYPGSQHARTVSQSSLKVMGVHDEAYFQANSILPDTGMPFKTVIPIPLYLTEVTFTPVIGLRGNRVHIGLETLLMQQTESLSRVDYSRDHSDKEMVQLSEKPISLTDDIYQNIDTNIYANVHHDGKRSGSSRSSAPPLPSRQPSWDPGTDFSPPKPGASTPPRPVKSKNSSSYYKTLPSAAMHHTKHDKTPRALYDDCENLSRGLKFKPQEQQQQAARASCIYEEIGPKLVQGQIGVEDVSRLKLVLPPDAECATLSPNPDVPDKPPSSIKTMIPKTQSPMAIVTSELQMKLNRQKAQIEETQNGAKMLLRDSLPIASVDKGKSNDQSSSNASSQPQRLITLRPTKPMDVTPNSGGELDTPKSHIVMKAKTRDPASETVVSHVPANSNTCGPVLNAQKSHSPGEPLSGEEFAKDANQNELTAKFQKSKDANQNELTAKFQKSKDANQNELTAKFQKLKANKEQCSEATESSLPTVKVQKQILPVPAAKPQTPLTLPPANVTTATAVQAHTDGGNTPIYTNEQEMALVRPVPRNASFPAMLQKQLSTEPAEELIKPLTQLPVPPKTCLQPAEELVKPLTQLPVPPKTCLQPADLPQLEKMTIDDVRRLLSILRLEKHEDMFVKERVDGVILKDLDEATLREEFSFTRIEIVRLMAFITKGHIPQ